MGIVIVVAGLLAGCATNNDAGGSGSKVSSRLRPGMTYREVGKALGSVEPGIRQNMKEALQQEADAQKDYERTVLELRGMGLPSVPPMRSQVSVYSEDYVLQFKDGRLTAWSLR